MSYAPTNHPVKRPNFFFNARFEEGSTWDELEFKVDYKDGDNITRTATYRVGVCDGSVPGICPPVDATINNLTLDELIAHVRMGSWLSARIPGTTEWEVDFVTGGETANFQVSIGTMKVLQVSRVADYALDIVLRVGNKAPDRVIRMDFSELDLRSYLFDPGVQTKILPGALRMAGCSFIHKQGDELTAQEKADIIAAVQEMLPYV